MAQFARKTTRLPRRMSINNHSFAISSLRTTRLASLIAGSASGLVLATILTISSVLPSARPAYVDAPAAGFAVAGLIGAVGDAGALPDTDLVTLDPSTFYGTLTFGDPADPPPAEGGQDGPVPAPETPVEAPPVEAAPAPVEAPPAEALPTEIVLAPEQPAQAEGQATPVEEAPAPVAAVPAEAAPAPAEAAPAPAESAPAPVEAAPAPAPVEAAPPAESPSDQLAARGVRASAIARTLVGRAYRYGGAGPRAFDCSGLTLYIYKQLGITLPHKARSQFNTRYGQLIPSMRDLMPGDLVYFRNTAGRGITHAAIYVGDGKMVTANSPRQGVRLSSIYDAYWRNHWAGGIRPGR